MQHAAMRKITISLPQELVEFADRVANQAHISRSQVIGQALTDAQVRNEIRVAITRIMPPNQQMSPG